MSEPTRQEMFRAVAALGPFVRRWNLPLNPEDMDEIAYALLRHAHGDEDVHSVQALVEQQINEHEAKARQLRDAMHADVDRQRSRENDHCG